MVIATGETRDEIVRTDRARCRLHLGIARLRPSVRDVVADRAREEECLLGHVAELQAEVVQIDRAKVVAVDVDAAVIGVVEAREQLHDGRLARPGLPDQRDGLPGGDSQVDAAQRLRRLAPRGVPSDAESADPGPPSIDGTRSLEARHARAGTGYENRTWSRLTSPCSRPVSSGTAGSGVSVSSCISSAMRPTETRVCCHASKTCDSCWIGEKNRSM